MKVNKKVVLFLLIIFVCFSFPLLVFRLQDFQILQRQVTWKPVFENTMYAKEYPIITSVYENFYQSFEADTDTFPNYDLTDLGRYPDKKKDLEDIMNVFNREVNALLKENILDYDILEINEKDGFQVSFGVLSDKTKDHYGSYHLNQVYRLNSDHDVIVDYVLDKTTGKIISIDINSSKLSSIDKNKEEKIAWKMIEYLALDKIDDWKYSESGYESYKGKIQVYCEIDKELQNMKIKITPLWQRSTQGYIIAS